jgi:hypothetical protein
MQTDAAKLFLFVPIPAKAKKLGLLSIYKFSLGTFKRHRDYGNFLELFFYLQSRLLIRQRFLVCMENRLKEYKHMFRYCK